MKENVARNLAAMDTGPLSGSLLARPELSSRLSVKGQIERTLLAIVISITELVINHTCLHPNAGTQLEILRLLETTLLVESVHFALTTCLPQRPIATPVPLLKTATPYL